MELLQELDSLTRCRPADKGSDRCKVAPADKGCTQVGAQKPFSPSSTHIQTDVECTTPRWNATVEFTEGPQRDTRENVFLIRLGCLFTLIWECICDLMHIYVRALSTDLQGGLTNTHLQSFPGASLIHTHKNKYLKKGKT